MKSTRPEPKSIMIRMMTEDLENIEFLKRDRRLNTTADVVRTVLAEAAKKKAPKTKKSKEVS